jgi:hypothetical protein
MTGAWARVVLNCGYLRPVFPSQHDHGSRSLQILGEIHILLYRRLVEFPCEQLLSVCLIRKRLRGGLPSNMTSVAGSLPCEDLVVSGLLLGKLTVQFHDTAL